MLELIKTFGRGLDFLRRLMLNLVFFVLLAGVIVVLVYDKPASVPQNAVLLVTLSGQIVEEDDFNGGGTLSSVFDGSDSSTRLRDVTRALESAAAAEPSCWAAAAPTSLQLQRSWNRFLKSPLSASLHRGRNLSAAPWTRCSAFKQNKTRTSPNTGEVFYTRIWYVRIHFPCMSFTLPSSPTAERLKGHIRPETVKNGQNATVACGALAI